MHERRKESRLKNVTSSFVIHGTNESTATCLVNNVSRHGIGITLPETLSSNHFPAETMIDGTLGVGHSTLQVKAIVRVSRGNFRGLEFVECSQDFQNQMGRILSPKYIASSIAPLEKSPQTAHLEYGFRGDEFEVLSFKKGRSSVKHLFQIFAAGHIVEITGSEARSVPAPLVRRIGDASDYSFMAEFTESGDGVSALNLPRFFTWVQEIIAEWPLCPSDFREAVTEQLKDVHH